ncbi:MAG: ABC transporter ATP-binding protein [Clostridium sp.]|nr:ABC transporter ATP-binding protein [Clostridium sp.]
MNIISVENVTVKLKKNIIIDIDNLNIEKGLCTGFVGRNGSGKSMLFKAICGFIKYSGKISVNGNIIGNDCDFIKNAGVVIEQSSFIGYITPFENLKILAQIRNVIGDDQIKNAMEAVGIDPKMKIKTSALSLGMKQRLRIAQAIMEDPEILIFDEPFNGLDENGVSEIRNLILNFKNKKTILLTSHIKEDIETLCDVVYHMSGGKITDKNIIGKEDSE